MLGVTLDLTDESLRRVLVSNKQSRIEAMRQSLEDVLECGTIQPSAMPSLFGRLQFCEAELLGRQGKLAMADLRSLERLRDNRVHITAEQRLSFASLLERMTSGTPRTIFASPPTTPILIFTDGACEPQGDTFVGSVGGVIVIPKGDCYEMRA